MANDTEVPVLMRFLAETEDVQQGAKDVEQATSESIDHLKTLADTASSVAEAAVNRVSSSYQSLKKEVQSIAAATAAIGAATSAGIVAAGGSAVKVASNFEDLKNKLEGLTGSAEAANQAFGEAVAYAANTKFDVGSIVAATAQLEAFGVGGKENLELVANIATATGGNIEEVSLRVAKALSGSSEGFQALRDTAGITGEKLAKFGANLSSASLVSVKTAKDVQLATKALRELGKAQFGGAAAKGANSFSTSISNAIDAVTNLRAALGEPLLSPLAAAARGFAFVVNKVADMAKQISPLIAIMSAISATMAATVGVIAGFGIPLAGLIAKAILTRKAMNLAIAAIGQISGGAQLLAATQARVLAFGSAIGSAAGEVSLFSGVSTFFTATAVPQMTAALASLKAYAATTWAAFVPFVGIVTAAAVTLGVGLLAAKKYTDRQIELGKEIQKSSQSFQGAATSFREYTGLLSQASGLDFSFGTDVRKTAAETKAALESISAVDLAAALSKAGISVESLSAKLKDNRKAAEGVRERLRILSETYNNASGQIVLFDRLSGEAQQALTETLGKKGVYTVQELEQGIKKVNFEFARLGQLRTVWDSIISRVQELPTALDKASISANSLNKFLGFASRIDDVGQLRSALSTANDEIVGMERNLKTAVGTLDRLKLAQIVADPNTEAAKAEAIKAYVQALDARAQIEQKIAGEVEKAKKAEVQAYELVTERRKVLGDLTLEQERTRVKAQLQLVQQGSADEVAILKQLATLDEQIRKDRVKKATDLIQEESKAIADKLGDVQAKPNVSNKEVAKEIRASITALEAFQKAHKEAFASAPEEATRFADSIKQLKRELQTRDAAQLSDQFKDLQKVLSDGVGAAGNTAQQIERTASAIDILKKAMASGTVDQSQAEAYLVQLEQKKLDLNRQQTDEKLKQANDVAALAARGLEEEIAQLELRQAAGEKVDQALKDSREQLLQYNLDAIDKERAATIKAGGDIELADKEAALKRQSLLRKETTRQFQEAQRQQTAVGKLTSDIRRGASGAGGGQVVRQPEQQNSVFSGPNSGVAFSGIQASGFAAFGENFGISNLRQRATQPPKFVQVEQRVQQQVAQAEKKAANAPAAQAPVVRNEKNTFNIDGTDGDLVKKQMVQNAKELVRRKRQTGLSSGSPGYSPIGQSRYL